jgi:beta-mannanase
MLPSTDHTLAQLANGDFDAHYQFVADNLVSAYAGRYSTITIRLGWEMNLTGWAWSCVPNSATYVAAFRRAANILKSKPGLNVKIDWNPGYGAHQVMNIEPCYPGDDVVDIIGLDVYEAFNDYNIANHQVRWQWMIKGNIGLYWLRSFAQKHNKPVSFPEWATGNKIDTSGNILGGAGDNPYFIEQMYYWMQNNETTYQGYWNKDSGGVGCRLDDGNGYQTLFPNTAAKFKELFSY